MIFLARYPQRFCEFDGQIRGEEELAEVVQQAAGGSLFGLVGPAVFELDNLPREAAGENRVVPQGFEGEVFQPRFFKGGKGVGQQDEGPGGFHAEIGDCFRRPRHLQLEAEHYGI